MLNWDDMRVFLAVARAQSLSGAGRVLGMDPATVGRRVQRLEAASKTRLFAKSPQGYALSSEGERMLDRAEQAEQAITLAEDEAREQQGALSGVVRLGATDGCANYLLPQVCAEICARNPGLSVQIVAQPRMVNLSRREADMAVVVSPPDTGRLTVQKITDYRLHLAASRSYLQRHPPIRSLADLNAHRMVGYIPDMIFDKELDYQAATGQSDLVIASNSVSVQVHALQQGLGVGVLHDFAMPHTLGLQKVLEDSFSLTRSFYLLRHADDRRVERLARFGEELISGLRDELARAEALT